jgi:hypothetical protein
MSTRLHIGGLAAAVIICAPAIGFAAPPYVIKAEGLDGVRPKIVQGSTSPQTNAALNALSSGSTGFITIEQQNFSGSPVPPPTGPNFIKVGGSVTEINPNSNPAATSQSVSPAATPSGASTSQHSMVENYVRRFPFAVSHASVDKAAPIDKTGNK